MKNKNHLYENRTVYKGRFGFTRPVKQKRRYINSKAAGRVYLSNWG